MERTMKRAIIAAALCFAGGAMAAEEFKTLAGWNCSAAGIKAAEYGGGDVAAIQLESDKQGAVYTVARIDAKTARGVTRNGTPFTCRAP
jgi:hypothetical protein